ncbi:unnamed protein product [Symbiodinium sp. CCMP2592]|nr:unnamed protein product [Symbiodinium sp. CCMP2592]
MHDTGAAASSSGRAFTRDLRDTHDRLRGQTASYSNAQIAGYYARDRGDAESEVPAGSEDEYDDDNMGFTRYGHGSPPGPPSKKSRSLLGSSPRKPALKRPPSQTLTDLLEKDDDNDLAENPGQGTDDDMANASQRDKPDLDLFGVPSPVEVPSATRGRGGGRGRGGKGGGRGSKKGADASKNPGKKGADAAVPPQELLFKQLEKDRAAFADRVLWETRVKDKAVEKMGNNLEALIDKVLATDETPDAVLMEDCGNNNGSVGEALAFMDGAKKKNFLFNAMQKSIDWLQAGLQEDDLITLKKVDASLLSEIYLAIAKQLHTAGPKVTADEEKKRAELFLKMVGLGKTDTTDRFFSLQIYKDVLAKAEVTTSEAMAVQLQSQIMTTWWDKVLRLKDANKMRALMACMSAVPALDLGAVNDDFFHGQMNERDLYGPTVLFEVQMVRTMLGNYGEDLWLGKLLCL